jgi:hypothetical protein
MSNKTVTVALSTHRPETLPEARRLMQQHEAVALEEPRIPEFQDMLEGRMGIEDYLMRSDFEYPLFAEASCMVLKELYRTGKAILQVEPYLETLYQVQEFLMGSKGPEDIPKGTNEHKVYDMEHRWYGALLSFYETSRGGSFDETVEKVKDFAKLDAKKGEMRDGMRAEALSEVAARYGPLFVEAGYIHSSLTLELQLRLPSSHKLNVVRILEDVSMEKTGRKQVLGPGDVLTYIYTHDQAFDDAQANLLAARSLVYNKIIHKEEMVPSKEKPYPHLDDEIMACDLLEKLSYEECKEVYGKIGGLPTRQAADLLRKYFAAGG